MSELERGEHCFAGKYYITLKRDPFWYRNPTSEATAAQLK